MIPKSHYCDTEMGDEFIRGSIKYHVSKVKLRYIKIIEISVFDYITHNI